MQYLTQSQSMMNLFETFFPPNVAYK